MEVVYVYMDVSMGNSKLAIVCGNISASFFVFLDLLPYYNAWI